MMLCLWIAQTEEQTNRTTFIVAAEDELHALDFGIEHVDNKVAFVMQKIGIADAKIIAGVQAVSGTITRIN